MKTGIIIAIAFVLLVPTYVHAEESAVPWLDDITPTEPNIPNWIKNTAGWWAEGKISDDEFLSAVSYLKDSNIIKIFKTVSLNSTSDEIKNIASSEIEQFTEWHPTITDALKNPEKVQIKISKVTGELENYSAKIPITVTLVKPDGEALISKSLGNRGQYSAIVKPMENQIPGIYELNVKVEEDVIETKYAFLDGTPEKIPDWIKNNAGWWASDQISDKDFVSGIKFLVETEMIKPAEQSLGFRVDSKNTIKNPALVGILEERIFSKSSMNVISNYDSYQECRHQLILEGKATGTNLQNCKKIIPAKMDEWNEFFSDKSYSALKSQKTVFTGNSELINNIVSKRIESKSDSQFSHLSRSTSDHDCRLKAMEDDGKISSKEKSFCEQKDRVYYGCDYVIDSQGNIVGKYDAGCDSGYDYSNHDYSAYYSSSGGYYSNYGYSDADVQRMLDRADYYANKIINEIDPFARSYVGGSMSWNEYERKSMAVVDHYSNQYVDEFNDYYR